MHSFPNSLSLSLSTADHESQWGKLIALATSLTALQGLRSFWSGFQIVEMVGMTTIGFRIINSTIPTSHPINLLGIWVTNDVSCESGVDEVRTSFGYLNQDPEWQKMSSGFRTINSTIPTLHPIAFLRIGSWRGVCQFWWPQSGPRIRRYKKQGGKLAKLFFHLPQARACVRSAPLLIFLVFHCSSYLSDSAVYFSWFLPTFWCGLWRVSPHFLVTAVSSMWRWSSWWCPQDLRSSFFPFFQIAESKLRKPSLLSLFLFFWCSIYGLCRSRCCMPWVVLSFMWISSEVMNWFVGLFLFGFCFPLHLFVGEISPSFACVPVFVVRLSKRNAVLLSSSSCSSFPVCRRSPVSAW